MALVFALLLLALPAFTVYVGELEARAVVLAWGKNEGRGNRIGRDAHSWGKATVRVGSHSVTTEKAWTRVDGLEPDTAYDYSVEIDGAPAGAGRLRTWAEKTDELTFLVIGDYGNGSSEQVELARSMAQLVSGRAAGPSPVRFVLTTGDNIYGVDLGIRFPGSGRNDADWWPRFFEPYRDVLARVPFYPTLGNHDGNESEVRADLSVYLDNFFFPAGASGRWYRFGYGGLADFFALDSTRNTLQGPPRPAFAPEGEQSKWLRDELGKSQAPWKIPYFHHCIFNAGPAHDVEDNEDRFRHWLEMFAHSGVKVVFEGHEHNFQAASVNARSLGLRHFVTGAGGELRSADVRSRMQAANVEAWAAQRHFLVVEIQGDTMTVTPVGVGPVRPVDPSGAPVGLPFRVKIPGGG